MFESFFAPRDCPILFILDADFNTAEVPADVRFLPLREPCRRAC